MSMAEGNFVIDTSIIIAHLLDDEESSISDAVIASLHQYKPIAPSFLSLEISNILLVAEKRCRIHSAKKPQLIEIVKGFEITEEVYSQERVFSRVLPMAAYHGLTTYDACYLELAARCSISLATLDKS